MFKGIRVRIFVLASAVDATDAERETLAAKIHDALVNDETALKLFPRGPDLDVIVENRK